MSAWFLDSELSTCFSNYTAMLFIYRESIIVKKFKFDVSRITVINTILNNLTLTIWLCVQMHQISDHTSSMTIVAIETKNISGDSGSNIVITLYQISKRLNVTKRHSL